MYVHMYVYMCLRYSQFSFSHFPFYRHDHHDHRRHCINIIITNSLSIHSSFIRKEPNLFIRQQQQFSNILLLLLLNFHSQKSIYPILLRLYFTFDCHLACIAFCRWLWWLLWYVCTNTFTIMVIPSANRTIVAITTM